MNVNLTMWNCNGKPLQFTCTKNIIVRDSTSNINKQFHVSIDASNNVLAVGLPICAPTESPNTDGIHISSSNDSLREQVGHISSQHFKLYCLRKGTILLKINL